MIDRTATFFVCLMIGLLGSAIQSRGSVNSIYQWAVPVAAAPDQGKRPRARAYLWIPEQCTHVRAVVLGQHNMLEEDVLDHAAFRAAMAKLNVAIVWVSPSMDHLVATPDSIKRFDAVLADLANTSGYTELATTPVLPIGHSAHASYPWNFAAWAPERTLGVLSVHGDAPQTPLAGFGPQHIRYPDGVLDGVPGLMVMGEYEWIDARWAPATVYRNTYAKAPIALLADVGEGHFAACDELVDFLAMFIRKCVQVRLPPDSGNTPATAPVLKPVDPADGWLVQRWKIGIGRTIPPAPAAQYGGDACDAFWAFDQEMAEAVQNYHADMVRKSPQLIGFLQDGKVVQPVQNLAMDNLKFQPMADDESFTIQPTFLDHVTTMGGKNDLPAKNNHMRWTGLPAGAPIGHASGGGPILVTRIEGPVEQTGPNTFRLQFYRGSPAEKAAAEKASAWFAARHPGDDKFKSAVQQATMNIPRNTSGAEQNILFSKIADQSADAKLVKLVASSSAGLPVHFYVREGPAVVEGDMLKILPIPPRAKFPLKVTVEAWQWGRAAEPKIQTAPAVEQAFSIIPAA